MAVGPADLGELHVQESPALARATLDQLKIVRRESDDVQVAEKIQMTTQRAGVDSDLLGSVSGQTNAYFGRVYLTVYSAAQERFVNTVFNQLIIFVSPKRARRGQVVNSLQQIGLSLSVGAHYDAELRRYF